MIALARVVAFALAGVLVGGLICGPAMAQVSAAKLCADWTSVELSAKVVTYAGNGFCYIQDDNENTADARVGGIRVATAAYTFTVGARVNVSGVIMTDQDGERYVEASSVKSAQLTSARVVPLMMSNMAVGGSSWNYNGVTGAGQCGVDEGIGLNNVGLLVRTSGVVTYVDPGRQFIYIDDGSGVTDGNALGQSGSAVAGIRVALSGIDPPTAYLHAAVTGVSSIDTMGGRQQRVILANAVCVANDFTLRTWVPMVCVPGGPFLMGNSGVGDDAADGYPREYPQHPVNVSTFWIGKSEVTRAQYRQFVNAGGYSNAAYWSAEGWVWRNSLGRSQPDYWADQAYFGEPYGAFLQGDSLPVVGVSYYEAEAFCNWAGGRLPTEAEWEKAARWDGTARIYPWGNLAGRNNSNDWYDTSYPGFQTAPSGFGGASPYACTDMAGNVWEWTQDWFRSYPGSSNPFDRTESERALRGGSWYGAYGNRCAARWFASPAYSDSDVGFRIAY